MGEMAKSYDNGRGQDLMALVSKSIQLCHDNKYCQKIYNYI